MTTEIKNAIIERTMLGKEDHGIMTAFLYLNFGGAGQGFGGYALDEFNQLLNKRVGMAYGMKFLIRILEVLEVEKWESLPGQHLRVDAEWGRIHGIGHILKNNWFYPDKEKEFLLK